MKKNKATEFYQVQVNGSLSRLTNARKAMSNLKGDNFKHNCDIEKVNSISDLDFNSCYCFIVNASGKAIEVDSLDEAKVLFNI